MGILTRFFRKVKGSTRPTPTFEMGVIGGYSGYFVRGGRGAVGFAETVSGWAQIVTVNGRVRAIIPL